MSVCGRILMLVSIISLIGCGTVAPTFKISEMNSRKVRMPGKAAVITSGIKDLKIYASISAKCRYGKLADKKGIHVDKTSFPIDMGNVGQYFIENLSHVFDETKVFENVESVTSDFEFILIPTIDANISYDQSAALNRYINEKRYEASPFSIFGEVSLGLRVLDKNKQLLDNIIVSDKNASVLRGFWCYDLFLDDPVIFHTAESKKAASVLLSETTEKTFVKLLDSMGERLQPIAKANSEKLALPSDLTLTASFSDTSAFFPIHSVSINCA